MHAGRAERWSSLIYLVPRSIKFISITRLTGEVWLWARVSEAISHQFPADDGSRKATHRSRPIYPHQNALKESKKSKKPKETKETKETKEMRDTPPPSLPPPSPLPPPPPPGAQGINHVKFLTNWYAAMAHDVLNNRNAFSVLMHSE